MFLLPTSSQALFLLSAPLPTFVCLVIDESKRVVFTLKLCHRGQKGGAGKRNASLLLLSLRDDLHLKRETKGGRYINALLEKTF